MKKGTIVLTPFPFTDLAGQKNRPALVLALSRRGEDVILAFISSVIREPEESDLLMLMEHSVCFEGPLNQEFQPGRAESIAVVGCANTPDDGAMGHRAIRPFGGACGDLA